MRETRHDVVNRGNQCRCYAVNNDGQAASRTMDTFSLSAWLELATWNCECGGFV